MRRDTFIKGMGAAGGAAFMDPIISLSEQAQEDVVTTAVSNRQVERLTEATLHHAYNYYELHNRDYQTALLYDLGKAGRLLQLTTTSAQRRELENAYARLAGIAAAFFFSQCHDARAQSLFESAEDAATACGDIKLLGWLYGRHCTLVYWTGGPREMLVLAKRGLEATASSPEAARLHARAARAYAIMRDRQMTSHHLDESERIAQIGDPGCWPKDARLPLPFTFNGGGGTGAQCSLQLGDYSAAVKGYEMEVQKRRHRGLSPRTNTGVATSRIKLGTALAHTGEMKAGAQLVTAAVSEYDGIANPLLLRHAHKFSDTLTALDKGGRHAREFADFLQTRTATAHTV